MAPKISCVTYKTNTNSKRNQRKQFRKQGEKIKIMKKSLRRKLLLSGLAMGVAALSLSATTYAWFTNNTKVDTTEINAGVALNNSLYIKSNLDNGVWGTRATLPTGKTLNPAHWNGTKLVGIDGTTDALESDYFYFTLQFKLDQAPEEDVNIKLTSIVVDGGTATEFTLKAPAGGNTVTGNKVAVSPLDSLYFVFGGNVHAYNKDATTEYDGLTYYNNVMGEDEVRPGTYTAPTEDLRSMDVFATIPAGSQESAVIDCYVYLEGWDKDNFDAICGNGFEVSFEFAI